MKILNVDYHNYRIDNKCLSLFSITFIKKYNCIPYCYDNMNLLVIVNSNFNFSNLYKFTFYTDLEIELLYVTQTEWDEIYQLIELASKRTNAVFKYQINKEENNLNYLNEDPSLFYRAEIENAPIVKLVDSIIGEAIALRASDVHIEPMDDNIVVRFRIDGVLAEHSTLPIVSLNEISTRIKVIANLDITKKLVPQDGKLRYTTNSGVYDVRVSILPTVYGERFVLRILELNSRALSIDSLGFSQIAKSNIEKLINMPNGMILVVGPTGSGKSTSLQAFLTKNLERSGNIITVEDPVEYTIKGANQVQINEEGGMDFATVLRSILRQDPNIIMIGEIRDLETAEIACRAAITGHLVYSTLHTNDSLGVINRLVDMNVERFLIVDSLRGIISQRLVRKLCPTCKKMALASKEEAKFLKLDEDTYIYHPKGCPKCNMSGYIGRLAVYEVIVIDEDFRDYILKGTSRTKFYSLVKKKKMETLFEHARSLILNGETSIEEIKTIIN